MQERVKWLLSGALLLLVVQFAAIIVLTSIRGVSARDAPYRMERWIARTARDMAVPGNAKRLSNPVAGTPEVLAEARAHWADHCAACHANNGSGDIAMGKHMYPPAPDMRKAATQSLSDGELFYIIQNGIRLTGMPAWGGSEQDAAESWKLVRFIRRLPHLTVEERIEMETLNPKGPAERKEEEEEEKFLKGVGPNEPQQQQHRHH